MSAIDHPPDHLACRKRPYRSNHTTFAIIGKWSMTWCARMALDTAMSLAVGGDYEAIGASELANLKYCGLQDGLERY
jgi:hypothetical protein